MTYLNEQTSLPNKNALLKDLQELLSETSLSQSALLFIDVDNFRNINNMIGHDLGDQLLLQIGERLVKITQPKGRVYHIGEDGFVILFPDASEDGLGEIMAAYVLGRFKESFEISHHVLHLTLSIGVVDKPPADKSIDEILTAAEIAMYQAKKDGRNQYVVFDSPLTGELRENIKIQKYLINAIEDDEFEIHYQPQLDLINDRIDGFEALLRWNSKKSGMVPPDRFIKAVEDNHMIIPLGSWVLRSACAFIKNLEAKGYPDLNISINISIIQLLQDDFVTTVQETLDFLELNPQQLELEITESMFMESFKLSLPKLEQLREMGVRLALDDFGTGYSSLSYLAQIPISTLKLDKSFIDKIETEQEGLIEGILYLCNRLNLSTVAEGVEHKRQIAYLKKMGCHKMQGYVFSKPLPEKDIINFLQTHTKPSDK
ncbi:MAG: putative bifunctional diguanylate cyclase/phosphodiesterase [Caldicoprobacterales bacterium]